MSSYVERVIDFLERISQNGDVPKMLAEDIQWAVDVISANKLYTGNMASINFNNERSEIRHWIDEISMKSIPRNIAEMERLKEYEELMKMDKN